MKEVLKNLLDKLNNEKYVFVICILLILLFVLTACVVRDSNITTTNDVKARVVIKKGTSDGVEKK